MAFDELLEALESAGFPVIAYADDAVVLVEGGSRRALEEGGAGVAGILEAWSASSKLEFCKSKSEWMLLKGHLDPRRGPHIVWGGQTMRGTQRVKYLGVTLTSGLRLGDHVEDVCERAKRAFFKVARLSGSGWGLTGDDLLVIYRGVFLGILLYAVPAWWPVLSPRSILERRLGSAQRAVLLKVVRAYRTTSGAAVNVLAGVLPVRLEAARRHAGYCIAKGLPFAVGGLTVDGAGAVATTKTELTEALLGEWQREWEEGSTGRWTRRFFPSVRERLQLGALPDFHLTQILGGHGDFRAKLWSLGLVEDPLCPQGDGEETAEHILRDCARFVSLRTKLEDAIFPAGGREDWTRYVLPTSIGPLREFARAVLDGKRGAGVGGEGEDGGL
ncbi:Retrotransposon protein [Nesidiocoris tenuis]|uniref:Retrotransposon protein n=1 Tax=Nesidiocoris tenuis TaxID=355587 RepID=A0ABN7B0J6_9HEMI|nr:Retrotransposon protein [Nesidiocoris tenuis]